MMSDDKETYHRDGFVLLRGWYSPAEFTAMREAVERYVREVVPGLPGTEAFYEDKADATTLKQLPRMEIYDPAMERLRRDPRLEALARELLDDEIRHGAVQWFNKPARIGGPTAPHQDGFYFMLEPNEALTFWIPLVPVDHANSCVHYVPGSHRRGMRPHGRSGILGFSQQITDFGAADTAAEVGVPPKYFSVQGSSRPFARRSFASVAFSTEVIYSTH
jgi:phytanoyl-CoA hydroxylase